MKLWNKIINIIRHTWLTFKKKIYRAVFKIFKNCSKFVMEVVLRKSLVLEIKKTQTDKTFMAQNITSRHISVSFGAISLKVFFYQSI